MGLASGIYWCGFESSAYENEQIIFTVRASGGFLKAVKVLESMYNELADYCDQKSSRLQSSHAAMTGSVPDAAFTDFCLPELLPNLLAKTICLIPQYNTITQ